MLHFHDQKLSIEYDVKGHTIGDIDFEVKRQKATGKELICEFMRFNPDDPEFFREIFFKVINNKNLKET